MEIRIPAETEQPRGTNQHSVSAALHPNGKTMGSAAKPLPKENGKKRPKPKRARKTPAMAGQLKWETKSIPICDLIVEKEDRMEPDLNDVKAQEKEKRFFGSISAYGIVEPLLVRRDKKSKKYVVIAGRRRFRAAWKLGLKDVPCRVLISDRDDVQETEIRIIENAEREDLTPYEWALIFKALSVATGQKTAAAKVYNLKKGIVSEYLLLLEDEVHAFLTPEQFEFLQRGQVSAKEVCRNVRKLKDARRKGTYDAILATIKGAKPKSHIYKSFYFDDAESQLSFQTKGPEETTPSAQQVFEALERWHDKLKEEVQAKTN